MRECVCVCALRRALRDVRVSCARMCERVYVCDTCLALWREVVCVALAVPGALLRVHPKLVYFRAYIFVMYIFVHLLPTCTGPPVRPPAHHHHQQRLNAYRTTAKDVR